MKVLILGAYGVLGHRVVEAFSTCVGQRLDTLEYATRGYATYGVDRPNHAIRWKPVDALEPGSGRALVRAARPDVVVNCIGIVKQRREAHDPLVSIQVNSLFPHEIATTCTEIDARLIHVGTDCVFSGSRGTYSEDDIPDPVDLYGRSKLLGEVEAPHLTLRTSFIGTSLRGNGGGLLDWLFAQPKGGTIQGYTRSRFTGLTSHALADLIVDVALDHRDLKGLYHVAAEPIAKHDLVSALSRAFALDLEIEAVSDSICDRTLTGTRFRQTTGWQAPSWNVMIEQLANAIVLQRDGKAV